MPKYSFSSGMTESGPPWGRKRSVSGGESGTASILSRWETHVTDVPGEKMAGIGLDIGTIHRYTNRHAVLRSRLRFFGKSLLRVFGAVAVPMRLAVRAGREPAGQSYPVSSLRARLL